MAGDEANALLRSMATDNARRFERCLEGVRDADLQTQVTSTTNHVLFIAAHVVDARYFLARTLEIDLENPLSPYLDGAASIEDMERFPPLSLVLASFRKVVRSIDDALTRMLPADLARPADPQLPATLETRGQAVAFLLSHEAYHIGQLAFLRKHLGYPAIRY